jgi:putative transposase
MSYPGGMMAAWDWLGVGAGPAFRCRPGAQARAVPRPGALVARFKVPDGWTVQAFTFALDCTPGQAACVSRQFGGRRYARNWAVRTLKDDLDRYRETGQQTEKPSLASLRKRWNQVKDAECTDAGTGEEWWPQISKEAFADGIKAAANAYWNWQSSRAGKRAGKRVGFPKFAKKGRDRDRVTFTTGAIRIEPDRRHVTLPRIGTVRVHENTRRLERLLAKGRARILAVTVSRKGTRLIAAFRVLVQRPQQAGVTSQGSRVGVDVGCGCSPPSPPPTGRSSIGCRIRGRWKPP